MMMWCPGTKTPRANRLRAATDRRPRRGFTLIELLLVLALLIVLAGLGLPVASSILDATSFRDGSERIALALGEARSESMRRGEPVEVVAREGAQGPELVMRGVRQAVEPDAANEPAGKPWEQVLIELSSPWTLESLVPAATTAEDDYDGAQADVLLATFLPQGGALARGMQVRGPGGASATIVISRWTGLARVERAEAGDSKARPAAPEQPVEDDADEEAVP